MRRSLVCLGLVWMGLNERVNAQAVMPDGTLNTIVTVNRDRDFAITGGITAGTNLFHSFREFSIPTGGSVVFNNDTTVQNIFSRVTGGTVSSIDGILRTNGTANLFLLNPSGILFGSNAQLNVGGSFIGTSAQAVKFADQTEFSATAPTSLLTISAPIGLQLGTNPAAIEVRDQGHQLQFPSTFAPVIGAGQQTNGLNVNPNQTLALIGGALTLTGGVLNAPSGQIELGSVANGTVSLTPNSKGFAFGYDTVSAFRDIQLTERSTIDASGAGNATVQLVGRNIALTNGSIALIVNQMPQPGGNLRVIASESLQLSGRSSSNPEFGSLLVSDAFAGSSANISIVTPRLLMSDRGIVAPRLFGNGTGGSIQVNASTIQIDGAKDNSLELHSGFLPTALGTGNMGAFTLFADRLELLNGGYINASTAGSGTGSEVNIRADTIRIDGVNPIGQSSLIAAAAFSSGNAGNLTLNAREVILSNGGTASTSIFNSGKAGNVTINATESITVTGRLLESPFSTTDGIGSSANILPPAIRRLLNLPDRPTGHSGDVIVTTDRLSVLNGGEIKVDNQGSGNAGTVRLNANTIELKNRGSITAATTVGSGGNIELQARSLIARNQSAITATAGGSSNGGNLKINVPIILGLENSDLIANADRGRGGNISITTQSIIGLQQRDRLTPESDITASSESGINGTVQVNTIGIDPNSGLVELSEMLADSSQQVAAACVPNQGSSFVITGRGGIPQNPTDSFYSERPWADVRPIAQTTSTPISSKSIAEPLVEATSLYRNPQTGKVELIAGQTMRSRSNMTCAIEHK
ncbi:filamentous hemagglutinin family outer membrane protein [Leptolyngbya sp. NIES-3755]|nr:filamentous hemagglutinin family outer membrane protein [Leptolyngbya sp. NIES-3755]